MEMPQYKKDMQERWNCNVEIKTGSSQNMAVVQWIKQKETQLLSHF